MVMLPIWHPDGTATYLNPALVKRVDGLPNTEITKVTMVDDIQYSVKSESGDVVCSVNYCLNNSAPAEFILHSI